MEIDVGKENICINKLIAQKKELIFVEEDMIVPDSKPDILNSVNLSGNVCIYKKEVLDGKIKIEGCVNTYIMYIPDSQDDNLRGLNANIEFSKVIEIQESKEGMDLALSVNIKDLECKVLNGRKINVRAGLEVNIKLYSNEDISVISGINNISDLQTLSDKFSINSLVGTNSTKVYIKDTLNIDEQDEIAEILKADVNLTDCDIKISYNKILSKCEADVKIIYLTEDNRINVIQGKIPAVGFIDMQNISEDNICDIKNEISNIVIKPNPAEEHSIYIEIELVTNCTAYERKDVELIQDLYSPSTNLTFNQKRIVSTSEKMAKNTDFSITSKLNIPEIADGNLLDTELLPNVIKEQTTASKILYEGEMTINIIYTNSNNSINSNISKVPFEFSIDNPLNNENINVDTKIKILNKNFDVKQNGDININVDLEATSEFSQNISMNIIDNIEVGDDNRGKDDYDSLVIYIVQKGDTLWKIAKKFRSTVDDIARANGIENVDKIDVGQKLFIPKFRYVNAISA